ncbi:fibrocystin-L-like [Diadema setosum]|uniref:fibrocystin-L-like n=1 Tax=Diadema setosum TaxID=31175 RepID=UPI003B3B000F
MVVFRPGVAGYYEVVVEVNGEVIPRCTHNGCRYRYWREDQGAQVTAVYTQSGPIGTKTTLYGKFFTIIYDSLQQSLEDEGSWPLSLKISGQFGYARPQPQTYLVNGKDERYHFQQYPEITDISPRVGSTEGGTELTITGTGFIQVDFVKVGGVPCKVDAESVTPTQLKCRTGPAPPDSPLFPGNRGLVREVLLNQKSADRQNLHTLDFSNTSDPNYQYEGIIPHAGTTEQPEAGPERFASRLTGYFVPPHDGDYTFYVRGDDYVQFWLSNSSSPDDVKRLASIRSYKNNYFPSENHPNQMSETITLQGGDRYYLEAYHFDWAYSSNVEVAVGIHKTKWTASDISVARNDVQRILTLSASHLEVQTIRQNGQRAVQLVSLDFSQCGGVSGCGQSGPFTVAFDGQSTDVDILNSTNDLEGALNSLSTLASNPVSVQVDSDEDVRNFTVTFTNAEAISSLIGVTFSGNETFSVSVEEVVEGAANVAPTSFAISYGGGVSTSLSFLSTAEEVKEALVDMLTVQCTSVPNKKTFYFYQSYEEDLPTGTEYGERVQDTEAYCGRTSLKNPEYIYWSNQIPGYDDQKEEFDISTKKKVCFAIKGLGFQGNVQVYFTRKDKRTDESSTVSHVVNLFEDHQESSEEWTHHCLDLYDLGSNDFGFDYQTQRYLFGRLKILFVEGLDFFVDQLTVAKSQSAPVRSSPVQPNGIIVSEVVVETISQEPQGFRISMQGANCGHSFPLLAIEGADVESQTNESTTYRDGDWAAGASVVVERESYATPPMQGTFDLSFGDRTSKDIPADVSESQLKSRLEVDLLTGFVQVLRFGSCSAYSWDVEFTQKGGSQPLFQVSENNLYNGRTEVSMETEKLVDGHVFLAPIPGEFLRSVHPEPQVELSAKTLAASCKSDCSFFYSEDATPTLLSISPSSGSAYEGTSVTLTGTRFSENVTVTINDVECEVTSVTETEIVCDVGESAAGEFHVMVNVDGLGIAATPNGNVTFTYNLGVSSVTPSTGSTAGGTNLTIVGFGFSEGMEVTAADMDCVTTSVGYSQAVCQVQPATSGAFSTSIVISIGDIREVDDDGFTPDSDITPSITSLSPTSSGVLGGAVLTISGQRFDTTGATVSVGGEPCEILSQADDEITCTLPSNPPGEREVIVNIDGVGFPTSNIDLIVNYNLKVTGLFPSKGSVKGGTEVSITGQGFGKSSDDIEVTLGGRTCELTSAAASLLTCVTPNVNNQHVVSHDGKHEVFGVGYAWNPSRLDIIEGDTVTFTWAVPKFVEGIAYSVHQTAKESATVYDGSGFNSGDPTTTGQFSFKFDVPGTYYFSSDAVNGEEAPSPIYMTGVIVVGEATSVASELYVSVGGLEAEYDVQSGASAPSGGSCPGVTSVISGCSETEPDSSEESFSFLYSVCHTPSVSSIGPNTGTNGELLTIAGVGFSDESCDIQVSIGDQGCTVQSASSTEILCQVDAGAVLNVGILYPVTVNIKNRGLSQMKQPLPLDRSFVLFPRVDDVSAHQGSLVGGTQLILTGDGFSSEPTVLVGFSPCSIQSYNYTHIHCVTNPYYEGVYDISVIIGSITSRWATAQNFTYSNISTPVVESFSPGTVEGDSTIMSFSGYFGPSSSSEDVTITVGGTDCEVTSLNSSTIICDVSYVPVGTQNVMLHIAGMGDAHFETTATVWSEKKLYSVTPSEGSTSGGQEITISGNGFITEDTTVSIGGTSCAIQSVTISSIVCITPSGSEGSPAVEVSVGSLSYDTDVTYTYSAAQTPTVSSVLPSSGQTGDTITVSGTGFNTKASLNTVSIDGVECSATSTSTTSLECTVGAHSAGTYTVEVHVKGKGNAESTSMFEYDLSVSDVSPNEGSFGGGRLLTINGSGFDSQTSQVYICNNPCSIEDSTGSYILCEVPPNYASGEELDCQVSVWVGSGLQVNATSTFTYRRSLTPTISGVSPRRGGTAGGTRVTINGTGFLSSGNIVTIGGTECIVDTESETEIVCVTEAHFPNEMTEVKVEVGSNGAALADSEGAADYFYIDVWSSRFTWGNQDPPEEGAFATIGAGQTILLDVDTPVLRVLLIEGGTLIFDEKDLTLNAEYIIITEGGHFQIGTEEEPFQHKATIVMHGHVRSTELPLFGAKTFAVRNGTVDMHGKHVPIMWTHLAETIEPGATQLTLMKAVTWEVGDHFVIASTGDRHKQNQNEERTITAISGDGMTLTFEPPMDYEHISIVQEVEGVVLETRAEVGLLTHNVKMMGNVNSDWTEQIEACEEEFNTGMFETQTCFLGRFGDETASDQFGSQIMFFAKEQDAHLVQGRLEYVEFTHAGQAFRLGRYPIHFHMNGNVTGSYVRGCSVHHTFNRAVTIHGVHGLLVEHNVAFNIMGHAFFMEDGIETNNVIQYNLAVFVRPSSSLLNVDVTPASFWVTNPDNTVRHNAAAGGSHFGFWYNMPQHPGGPSFTTSVCPRNVPLREFTNNTAHTMGWYGIWIFPSYFPKVGGGCGATESTPAKYYNLTVWNTERGAEAVSVGAIQFHNFLSSDTVESGFEYQIISEPIWGDEGALIKDSTVIAWTEGLSGNNDSARCTKAGVLGPHSRYLTVDGVTFINFNRSDCAAVGACSKCRFEQGGFPTRFTASTLLNSPNKARFQWKFETWLEDLDGSLTAGHPMGGQPNTKVVPDMGTLPSDCETSVDAYSLGVWPGAICRPNINFHRFAFNNPSPESLLYKKAFITNAHGTAFSSYHKKRITNPKGWMVLLIDGEATEMYFANREHVTNISYTGKFDDFGDGDFVVLSHNLTQKVDVVSILGDLRNTSESPLTYAENNNGDYYINPETNDLTYIVSGKGNAEEKDVFTDLDVYRCYFKDCIPPVPEPPPEGRPAEVFYWSNPATWENVTEGWGGHGGGVPEDGDDVQILPGLYVIANSTLPTMNRLFIYGTLELDDVRDFTLRATYILIQGGALVIGQNETTPFTHNAHIILEGNHNTPDIPLPDQVNLGSKALGVFGSLKLHGKPRQVIWTHLATTVLPGDDSLTVEVDTDWVEGDEIVVATTDYESWHTETFAIVKVVDQRTFRVNSSFVHRHTAASETLDNGLGSYKIAAEVGLLTRNVIIEGADYPQLLAESFGARVLVGRFFQDGTLYEGRAQISYTQFKHSGQEGYIASYDPRFSVSFLNLGDQRLEGEVRAPSYVRGCSFHHGFSPAIGVFASDFILIEDNIIHHTVGSGIVVESEGVELIHNLVTLSIAPATYQDRFEKENLFWDGGIHISFAEDLTMSDNAVAGAERAGFRMQGEPCGSTSKWKNNVAHSALEGIMLFLESQPTCSMVANFLVYRCFHYGIYTQISSPQLTVTNVTLVDNKNGIVPLAYLPPALSHVMRNKEFRITSSVLVGTSDSFDCDENRDENTPEVAGFVRKHKAITTSHGGPVGIVFTTFMSGSNGAPFFSFYTTKNYPALGGRTVLEDVAFVNYNDHCGNRGSAIVTNPIGDDAQHPVEVHSIQFLNTDTDSKVFIHRPSLGKVNPSDCVDMDCDGHKKAIIRDLDGSFLGSVGSVIPDSAYEWDGDPRRGLGDYRIPRMLLTDPLTGDQLDVNTRAPHKGIIGQDTDNCQWRGAWNAYECHGYDHRMMLIESMDADTETRRVSPIALLADGQVDLINGPQDHGWCLGYTCQERISTFNTIVATGKEYEVYFTGTNPQHLRFYLLNAAQDEGLVVGIWYANPQRLDVYSRGIYIVPNNGEFVGGELQLRKPQSEGEFRPSTTSRLNGENYFDRDTKILYFVLAGPGRVDIKTVPVVTVTFGVPAVSIDDFFEENLRANLAALLNIHPSKIRIVDIVREDSRRRRRAADGQAEVVLEISNPVTVNGTANTTTASNTTGATDSLVSLQETLVDKFQEGDLGSDLNISISTLAMVDPVAEPVDPTGGVRATNETGGPSSGNETFAERQAAEEAAEQAESGQPVVYLTPTALVIVREPAEGSEFAPLSQQPSVKVVDQEGNLVTALGHSSSPWLLTATIIQQPDGVTGQLLGNVTLPFQDGWANFSNLAVDKQGSGYMLEFSITRPEVSPLSSVRSAEFTVTPRRLTAVEVDGGEGDKILNEAFEVVVEIRDVASNQAATNLYESGFNNWTATVSLYQPSYYRGQISGQTTVTVDLATGQAAFPDLVIDEAGYGYVLNVDVVASGTDDYSFSVQLDPFDVVDRSSVPHTGDAVEVQIIFDSDYSIVEGQENTFISIFRNKVAYQYTNVTLSNFMVSEGSILLTFDMTGDTDGTIEQLFDDLQNGDVVVTIDGHRLEADPILMVNGEEYTRKAPSVPFPLWAIVIVVLLVVLFLVVVVIVIVFKCCLKSKAKVKEAEVMPLHHVDRVEGMENTSFKVEVTKEDGGKNARSSPTGSRTTLLTPSDPSLLFDDRKKKGAQGKAPKKPDGIMNKSLQLVRDDDRASTRSTYSNSPRRTPEVEVTALPPGFTEGQIEKDVEDRTSMPINIKNPDGTFQKLGDVEANLVGTLSDLRVDIKKSHALPPKLQEKAFVFLRAENLEDYQTPEEKRVSVSEGYGSTRIILVRWHSEQDASELCVCGLVGQFHCSLCQKQAYCSPQCQSTDWPRHTGPCSIWSSEMKV